MTLPDSSAWIEYLRDTGSATCNRFKELLLQNANEVMICAAVRMEVLAGARDGAQYVALGALLSQARDIPTLPEDFDRAAELYRRCRQRGETVRNLIDCLIAAVAIRAGFPVLHNDRDFDVLARYTELQLDSASR